MTTIDPKMVANNIEKFNGIISIKIIDKKLQTKILKMLEFLGDRFYDCPASSKLSFHNAFPGGLICHSLNVTDCLIKLAKTFYPEKYNIDRLYLIGLFHDVGKVGSVNEDVSYYIENDSQWHIKNRGEVYKINDKLIHIPHAVKSAIMLAKFGINLNDEELQAILAHDGLGLDDNQTYKMREYPLALLLSFADRLATQLEKNNV